MIYGYRITKIRELLHLSKEQLALSVCVSVATINNWENGKSNPRRLNLELLARTLHTTTDYLEGLTDNPSCVKHSDETVQESPAVTLPDVNVCEICGKPVPERIRKCPSCRWKSRWPESLLNSPRLETRRKRSHTVRLLSLDLENSEAIFGASTDKNRTTYITTIETCTCRDFEMTRGEIPCKHILRLAGELGFFQSEYFAPGEDDYTLHVVSEIPDDDSESYQMKPAEMAEPVKYLPAVVSEPENLPHKPGIFLWLLKYATCCFLGFWAVVFTLRAIEGDKAAMCFSVAFMIAGTLTAITANRKGEESTFMWWVYGALVPVVSWIDVAMLNSENKAKSFMNGIKYSLVGFAAFVIVFVQFLPSSPTKEPLPPKDSPVLAVMSVSEDVKPEPKVSEDLKAKAKELLGYQGEWEREDPAEEERLEREQEAEKKRQVQEYLKKANTVVVTPKGKRYHESNCRTVRGSSRTMTIAQAKKRGYTPCKVCNPPSSPVTIENINIYWGDDVYTSGKKSILGD